jgi:hypothetical protein
MILLIPPQLFCPTLRIDTVPTYIKVNNLTFVASARLVPILGGSGAVDKLCLMPGQAILHVTLSILPQR